MRKRFMTYDTAARVPGVPAPGGNVASIVLIVCKNEEGTTWNQRYTFDEIYNAALAGILRCFVAFRNGDSAPEGEPDSLRELAGYDIGLPGHEEGRFVSFWEPEASAQLMWSAGGFAVMD